MFVYIILYTLICLYLLFLPYRTAKKRGIHQPELTGILILSFLGVIGGVTWVIALILSLVMKPKIIEKSDVSSQNNLKNIELLGKLRDMKNEGIITEQEFQKEKEKLMQVL